MEVRHVVQTPCRLQAILSDGCLAAHRCHCIRAEDDRIETAGWGVVDPFRCEDTYAVQRCEVDMLGGNELIACLRAQVFDVINKEGVGEGLLDQKDNLCTA